MAVYNEILVGRFNRALQKLFGIKGPPPVPQLSSEVMAIHPLQSGIENRYLEGWNRFGVFFQVNAVAANTSGLEFRNPTTSGVIAVFEKIDFIGGANAQWINSLGATTTDLALVVGMVGARFDKRGSPTSSIVASTQNTTPAIADLANQIYSGTILANALSQVIQNPDQEVPLLPGDGLLFRMNAINVALSANIWWRERVLEDSESK